MLDKSIVSILRCRYRYEVRNLRTPILQRNYSREYLGREGRNRGRVRGRLLLYRLDRYSRAGRSDSLTV